MNANSPLSVFQCLSPIHTGLLVTLLLANTSVASSTHPPDFVAECVTNDAHQYDQATGVGTPEVSIDRWTKPDFGPWRFSYSRGKGLLVQEGQFIGKEPVPIIQSTSDSILATTSYPAGFGGFVQWSFAINLRLGTGVGSNLRTDSSAAIRIRAWNMTCEIFNPAY